LQRLCLRRCPVPARHGSKMPICTMSAAFMLEHAPWKMAWTSASVASAGPRGVVAFRILLLMSWIGVTSWSAAYAVQEHESFGRWASYLTHWGLMLELIYLCMAVITSSLAVASSLPDGSGKATPWFARLTGMLYIMCVVISTLIFILFWTIDFPFSLSSVPITFFCHGFNAVVAWSDLWLVGLPIHASQAWAPMLFGMGYVSFSAAYVLHGSPANYTVLDWSARPLLALAISVGLVFVVIPAITWLFASLKRSTCCTMQGGGEAAHHKSASTATPAAAAAIVVEP